MPPRTHANTTAAPTTSRPATADELAILMESLTPTVLTTPETWSEGNIDDRVYRAYERTHLDIHDIVQNNPTNLKISHTLARTTSPEFSRLITAINSAASRNRFR